MYSIDKKGSYFIFNFSGKIEEFSASDERFIQEWNVEQKAS